MIGNKKEPNPFRVSVVIFLIGSLLLLALGLVQETAGTALMFGHNSMLRLCGGRAGFDVPGSCTIFTAAVGGTVLFGNNEDYRLEGTYMWIVPAQEIDTPSGTITIHGAVAFGYKYNDDPADGYAQGGMNDQGLCADGNALPSLSLNPHPERESPFTYPLDQILMECSTVNETIEWFQSHNLGSQWSCQIHFADASGDAVVVSVGADGEFAFTRKGSSNYLVSTNFNLANYDNAYAYPCQRYDTATAMLEEITSEEDLTVEACRDILDAVHEEGTYGTKYSNVFDSVNRDVYLYHNHNFDKVVTLNLDYEIANVNQGAEGVIEENGLVYKEIKIADLFARDEAAVPWMLYGGDSSNSSSHSYDSAVLV